MPIDKKGKSIRFRKEFLEVVNSDAAASGRDSSEEIEYRYRLGRLLDQYEDLPIKFIKSLIFSTREEALLPWKDPS